MAIYPEAITFHPIFASPADSKDNSDLMIPFARISPFTSSVYIGLFVLIPTHPTPLIPGTLIKKVYGFAEENEAPVSLFRTKVLVVVTIAVVHPAKLESILAQSLIILFPHHPAITECCILKPFFSASAGLHTIIPLDSHHKIALASQLFMRFLTHQRILELMSPVSQEMILLSPHQMKT
ncbi:MAG: hypothetical protein WCJ39_07260 [bacterium]